MLKTHKFARKPFYVDAVRVSEANIEEVASWCEGAVKEGPDGKFIQVKVHRPLTERQTQAYIGDWVLYAGTGFKVYVPKAFDKSFEKVRTLTKAQADEAGIKVPHEKSSKPKKQPSPRNMPSHRKLVTNVGKAIREAEEAKKQAAQPAMVVDPIEPLDEKVGAMVEQAEALDLTIAPPKSAADIEADKLIAEVDRLKTT